jgi:asparagine synthase (glutamine-hydrolysing)
VWAVLNGEIYNHPGLREHLLRQGHRLATRTDTEVIVHLWEEYGPGLVNALEGMFALAVWDERRGELFVARDRFGEKPLFYGERNGVLVFASELSALVEGRPGSEEIEPAAIDEFFVHGYVPGPGSIFRDVGQLPPGHTLRWSLDAPSARVEPYWTPARSPWKTLQRRPVVCSTPQCAAA